MDEIIYSAGSSAARSYPVSLVLSGWYTWGSGAAGEQNSASILWSSTAVESEIARLLAIRATTVQPQGTYYLTAGYALRCVEISAYGSTSARSYPVSLVYSGIYSWIGGGYLDYQNEWAFIYTSTTLIYNNKELGQDLLISKNVVNPGAGNDKRVGHTLRWL